MPNTPRRKQGRQRLAIVESREGYVSKKAGKPGSTVKKVVKRLSGGPRNAQRTLIEFKS